MSFSKIYRMNQPSPTSFEFPELPSNLPPVPGGWVYVGLGPIPWQSVFEASYTDRDAVNQLVEDVSGMEKDDLEWSMYGFEGTSDDMHYLVRENSTLHLFLQDLAEPPEIPTTSYEF